MISRKQRKARRSGLTLLEMMIVLLILIALAGILVPVLTNMNTRAHGSTASGGITEVAKAVQTHQAMYNESPNSFDALIDNSAAPGALMVAGTDGTDTWLSALNLADDEVEFDEQRIADALVDAGITITSLHDATTRNKTFEPYASLTPDNFIAADALAGRVVALTDFGEAQLGLDISGTYVAFGLGARCTMVGRSMVEAPVHFPERGSPTTTYSRFLVIYSIPEEGAARFATVATVHDEGLAGLGHHMAEYYETQE